MACSVLELVEAGGAWYAGVVRWGRAIPETGAGVYLVSVSEDPTVRSIADTDGSPISLDAVRTLMEARPELTLDGLRPTAEVLRNRIASFSLPGEPVQYIGKATSLHSRVDQYYKTKLGARSPHAGGWLLKTRSDLQDLWVHFATTREPVAAEAAMLRAFSSRAEPAGSLPFANLEGAGRRRVHGIRGATATHNRSGNRPASRPPSVTEASPSPPPQTRQEQPQASHRTQPVTEPDLRGGRIRIPQGAVKRLFPPTREDIEIRLRGRELLVRWDPRYGPDRERSGVLGIGKTNLAATVQAGEVLDVTRDATGRVSLD